MSYFKYSTSATLQLMNNNMIPDLINGDTVVNKYFSVQNIVAGAQNTTQSWASRDETFPVEVVHGSFRNVSPASENTTFGSNIRNSRLPTAAYITYGDAEFKACDVFSVNTTAATKDATSFVFWADGDSKYMFTCFDNTTTHYAGIATNNPDIAAKNPSFTFPVVKDFDIRTITNSLNGNSDKYIIQPLIAFGMKTPIFLITGANGADVPLFSEIEAQGKSYFVIGSNYCVEM